MLFWELDEVSGSAVSDSAGSNGGSFSGSYALGGTGATGGGSVSFASGDGAAEASNAANLVTHDLTAELWFKPSGLPATRERLLRLRPFGYAIDWTPSGTVRAWAYLDDGTGENYGGATVESGVVPSPTSDWTHVVLTVAGGAVRLYVNGSLVDDFAYSTSATTGVLDSDAEDFIVGGDSGGYRAFDGEIDDVAIYGSALSSTDVVSHYESSGRTVPPPIVVVPTGDYEEVVLADAPDAFWRLDDPENNPGSSGETAEEMNGVYPGWYTSSGVVLDEPGATGDGNTSAHFDGRQEVVKVPISALSSASPNVSIELWFKPDGSSQAKQRIMRARSYGFAIDWRPGSGTVVAWAYTDSNNSVSLESDLISADDWHHVVLTLTSERSELWLDGELQAVQANPTGTGIYVDGSELTIGNDRKGESNRNFIGWIDDVAIYKGQTLSPEQVRSHYIAAGYNAPPTEVGGGIEAIVTCAANGGNLFFEVSTYVSSEDAFFEGCYYVESCVSDMWSVVGAIAEWSCDNQDDLLQILDVAAVPAEILHNVVDHLSPPGTVALGGIAVARAPTAPPPLPDVLPDEGPASAGRPSWVARAGGALLASEVAYQVTEYVDASNQLAAVLAQDIDVLDRIADAIRVSPELSTVDAERQRRIAAMTCIETIAADQVASALGTIFDANGFDPAGDHACELMPVLFPGSSWTTGSGVAKDTTEATAHDAAAIANGAPAVLTRLVGGHPPGWYNAIVNGQPICDAPTGKQCQEYPFRSVMEGGRTNWDAGHVFVDPIDAVANSGEGNALSAFYQDADCGSGGQLQTGDVFVVVPIPSSLAPPTTWRC